MALAALVEENFSKGTSRAQNVGVGVILPACSYVVSIDLENAYTTAVVTAIEQRLEHLREQIRQSKNLYTLLPYELLPIIRETPVLFESYDHRIHYYHRLSKETEYLHLIDEIHAVLHKLHPLIEPTKLPELCIALFSDAKRNPSGEIKQHFKTYRDLHFLFVRKLPWYRLGSISRSDDWQAGDSHFCPWRNVLRQYKIVEDFLHEAASNKAIDPDAKPLLTDFQRLVTRLHQLLEEPWHRLHIWAFECIEELVTTISRQPGQEDDGMVRSIVRSHLHQHPQVAKVDQQEERRNAETVCDDLLLVIKEQAVKPVAASSKRSKKNVKWLGDGKLKYGLEEYQMMKKSVYACLCGKLYAVCQKPGSSMSVSDVYNAHQPDRKNRPYEMDRLRNKEWVYQTIRVVNRWAKKSGLPDLFKCKENKVERLV